MELKQIRYFVAVVEEESFSAAARRLYVSQPPVTRQIQQLEAELDVQLFERTRKGVELTPAGKAFLDEARQILTSTRLASERSRAAARGDIGNLEIGYFGSSIYTIIPKFVRAFCRQNKNIPVSLESMNKKEQIEGIKDGDIHIGFGRHYANEPGLDVETIASEKIVLAMPSTHPYADNQSISLNQLKHEPMILFPKGLRPSFADEVIQILRKGGIEPKVEHEATDLSSALALTAAEMGVCPVPQSVAQLNWPNVCFLPITKILHESPVNCIYAAGNQSPILRKVLETLRQNAPLTKGTAVINSLAVEY